MDGKGRVYIVAELGTAHGGSLDAAARLIEAAAGAGADCVKFQWVIAAEILHPLAGDVKLPGGNISLYRRFRELERPFEFYARLKELTRAAGVDFLCSPFGQESLEGLARLGVRGVKIASPELNHFPLLEAARSLAPVILSTGVSTRDDIAAALAVTGDDSVLLHCVTSYPAPEEDYNLRVIPDLNKTFRVPVGLSDHSLDPILVPVLAVSRGACLVEKHFTLSREDGGLDDPIALTPGDFTAMVREIRRAEGRPPEEVDAEMARRYTPERVEAVLGSGRKALAPSEAANYKTTRRSILALPELPAGTILTRENTAILRSEKNLTPGAGPEHWPGILGKKTKKWIPPGGGILLEDLEDYTPSIEMP